MSQCLTTLHDLLHLLQVCIDALGANKQQQEQTVARHLEQLTNQQQQISLLSDATARLQAQVHKLVIMQEGSSFTGNTTNGSSIGGSSSNNMIEMGAAPDPWLTR